MEAVILPILRSSELCLNSGKEVGMRDSDSSRSLEWFEIPEP